MSVAVSPRPASVHPDRFAQLLRAITVIAVATALGWAWSGGGRVNAQASPTRIGVVDVNKVLTSSAVGKAAYERLKKFQDDKMAAAQKMDDEIRALDNDINTKKISLPQDRIEAMMKQLSDKRIAMQRFSQEADRQIAEMRDKELAALNARIMPIVESMGREIGAAVILNKFESGLIYAANEVDLTDALIARFNGTSK